MVQLPSYDFYSSLQHNLSCSLIVGVNAAKVELCDYLSKLQGYTHARPLVSDAIRMLGISLGSMLPQGPGGLEAAPVAIRVALKAGKVQVVNARSLNIVDCAPVAPTATQIADSE